MVEFGRVPEKGRIRTSIEKWKNQGQYRKMIEIGSILHNIISLFSFFLRDAKGCYHVLEIENFK